MTGMGGSLRAEHAELIVNADDFGRSTGINAGVVEAHRHGIVTSASLMVRWPAAVQAARLACHIPALSVGLHVDLEEWVHTSQGWELVYQVVHHDSLLEQEVRAQLERFRRLVGRDPTHLDSHQHVHLAEPPASLMLDLGAELGVPVRNLTPGITHCGLFYGSNSQGHECHALITSENLISIIEALPSGVTELTCHPGKAEDAPKPYAAEREIELETLCDPRVAEAVVSSGVRLRSFALGDCVG